MTSEFDRQNKIISKTVERLSQEIQEGKCDFICKRYNTVGYGDIIESYILEGKAKAEDYQVIFKTTVSRDIRNFDSLDSTNHKWYFYSNLKKKSPDIPFVFEGSLSQVEISHRVCDPEAEEILELINNSISRLDDIQTNVLLDQI